ncbi:MAG: ABC transporter permease [Sarcina sp.]
MNGLIKTTILRQIRAPKYLIFLAVFPIILTLLIGGLIGNSMDSSISITPKTVYYSGTIDKNNQQILDIAKSIASKNGSEFTYKQIANNKEGINEVEKSGQLYVDFDGSKINIYATKDNSVYYNYLKSTLNGISKSINTVEIVEKNDMLLARDLIENNKGTLSNGVKVQMLSKTQTPTGFDYYAVAELTMIVMYIIMFPLGQYFEDKETKRDQRIRLAGTSILKYITGSTIGYFLLSFIVTLPSFLFSKYVLSVNWGRDPIFTYVIIQIFALASILIGTVVAFIFKDKEKATNIVQRIILPLFSFLGGSYIAFSTNALGKFGFILNISPLRWINKGIFEYIYEGSSRLLIQSGIIYLAFSIIIVLVLVAILRKSEDRI